MGLSSPWKGPIPRLVKRPGEAQTPGAMLGRAPSPQMGSGGQEVLFVPHTHPREPTHPEVLLGRKPEVVAAAWDKSAQPPHLCGSLQPFHSQERPTPPPPEEPPAQPKPCLSLASLRTSTEWMERAGGRPQEPGHLPIRILPFPLPNTMYPQRWVGSRGTRSPPCTADLRSSSKATPFPFSSTARESP